MKRPYIIAINAVSGGGKTALAKLLHASLPASALFCFDDFDNVYPEDFCGWYTDFCGWYVRGCDLLEFDCPQMKAAVEEESRNGTTQYIVLDYPFGRDHPCFREQIDLSVFIDTPLDVALARRILRDHATGAQLSSREGLEGLRKELAHYILKGRHVYRAVDARKETSDLVLDGSKLLEDMRDTILAVIRSRRGPPLPD